MKTHTPFFNYAISAASLVDIGFKRTSNQDEVILCPETGFYAVSDGMGGLLHGGETSQMIKQVLPEMIKNAINDLLKDPSPEYAAKLLSEQVRMLSDNIYDTCNKGNYFSFGATLSSVWFVGYHAVFVNLGDSRGYLLPRHAKKIQQVTHDHDVATLLVDQGEITKEEARHHPASSSLTRFVGMDVPARPEAFIRKVNQGDRILLCSDGLHGMVEDSVFASVMRFSENPKRICAQFVEKANANGGRDNISVVYIKIEK